MLPHQKLIHTLTMLYDAILHKPVAQLLCLFPCGGLTFLNQPIQEFRCHEGALILDSLLFPGLQECVFRAHQPGREKGTKNKPTQKEKSSFEILDHRLLCGITAKLSDRQIWLSRAATNVIFNRRICFRCEQDAFPPSN